MQYIVPKMVLLVMSSTDEPNIPGAKLQEPFENMPFQPYAMAAFV